MKNKLKNFVLLASIFLLSSACGKPGVSSPLPPSPQYNYSQKILVGKTELFVEVASDEKKMRDGLSGRQSLTDSQGMLFIFPKATTPGFWMKGMLFNLDLIWINQNKIVGITPDVPVQKNNLNSSETDAKLPMYFPPSPITQVLEVRAGWSADHKIKVGDEINFRN